MQAFDFTLPDQNGVPHTLTDYRGKWVVLYFYPKDDTPGCTKEACSFRDSMQDLALKNVIVLGVSADSPESHQKFINKYNLNFVLLSDESKEIIKKYNAWGTKNLYGKIITGTLRTTYLINPEGEIVREYKNVKPETHTQEILSDLQKLQKS